MTSVIASHQRDIIKKPQQDQTPSSSLTTVGGYTLPHLLDGTAAAERYKLPMNRNVYHHQCVRLNDATENIEAKKEEIRLAFHKSFEIYEKVFQCLNSDEAFYIAPVHKLRHPLIFYFGHTATFYINKLAVAGLTTRINPKFEEMFAIGVDEMSWDDLNESHYVWPSVAEVSAYRLAVRDRINELILSGRFELKLPLEFSESACNSDNSFWWVLNMGIEHERIHVETASVHVRELPLRLVKQEMSSFWVRCPESSDQGPPNEMIEVAGGHVVLGRPLKKAPTYGWDCDYGDQPFDVPTFKASKFLVSNAEFFAFVKEGGYTERKYWDDEGWNWVTWKKPQHPWFWVKDESAPWGYKLRLQTDLMDLPLDGWIGHVK